jgi:perosamine synthetase
MSDLQGIIDFVRDVYGSEEFVPLHAPRFFGNEKKYLAECVDSTFVSSVGEFVTRFENAVAEYTGAKHAIAVVNGTQALFTALKLLGAGQGELVITQSLTFVATANAIAYTGARPAFVDVDDDTLGMSPVALRSFLEKECDRNGDGATHRKTGARVRAVVPMHSFGHACRIHAIREICAEFGLSLLEDAAESLGTLCENEGRKQHTGTVGQVGILSFNGNKIVTTGGGGMILTDDESLGRRARHLTTTAKVSHPFEFIHDEVGYNFRLPNLNAALGVAQIENLPGLLAGQRALAGRYREFFRDRENASFVDAPPGSDSNFWMNAIRFKDPADRDRLLEASNRAGVATRAIWKPMHMLPMFADCERDALVRTEAAYRQIVNIPSTVPEYLLASSSGLPAGFA